jgi:hypothetical protein
LNPNYTFIDSLGNKKPALDYLSYQIYLRQCAKDNYKQLMKDLKSNDYTGAMANYDSLYAFKDCFGISSDFRDSVRMNMPSENRFSLPIFLGVHCFFQFGEDLSATNSKLEEEMVNSKGKFSFKTFPRNKSDDKSFTVISLNGEYGKICDLFFDSQNRLRHIRTTDLLNNPTLKTLFWQDALVAQYFQTYSKHLDDSQKDNHPGAAYACKPEDRVEIYVEKTTTDYGCKYCVNVDFCDYYKDVTLEY